MEAHKKPRAPWTNTTPMLYAELASQETGLTQQAAENRQREYGYNELPDAQTRSWITLLKQQCANPILIVLMIAGGITVIVKDWLDATVIGLAVVINIGLGWYQEAKAENTIALLKAYVKEKAKVIRDGAETQRFAREIVVGDIVRITQGDRIPADGRLITIADMQVDESVLTGESLPVEKKLDPIPEETPLGDRTNMVWSGTAVVQGYGIMIVTAIGKQTELGRIASLVEGAQHETTPLQQALRRFSIHAALVLGGLTVALFMYGVYQGYDPLEMFLISVATAVAAVPEGLPIAMTVILAIGVQRLAARKGIVRKLLAAETLGGTSIILTDKTGTLTEARMELEGVVPLGNTISQERLLEFAISHSDVVIENPTDHPGDWRLNGRPVEVALAKGSSKFGVDTPSIQEAYEVIDRLPFSSATKFSASIVRGKGSVSVVLMGAPEALLMRSDTSEVQKKEIMEIVDRLAGEGARVLAVASETLAQEGGSTAEHIARKQATLLGLLAFRDPIRASVPAAVARVINAGVRVVLVTGDHAGTASVVAREVGLAPEKAPVLLGSDIDTLDDRKLKERLRTVVVIARTTPEHKLRIARCYKEMGEIVAMTGDGVNDAPALKEANIGISLGTGSDVAKAAADLVLLDDNFETIVGAIEEGRNIVQNIRKVIAYVLANSSAGLLLIGGSLATGLAIPLTTLQILWVNLFTDSFPVAALAFERNHSDMGQGPLRIKKTIFDKELRFIVFGVGTATSILLFSLYWILMAWGYDPGLVRTFIFASFGMYTLFLAFAVRSLRRSILTYSPLGNTYLLAGTAIGVVMMSIAIYVPTAQAIFDTTPLSIGWVIGVVGVGLISIIGVEIGKWLYRKNQ